MKKFKFAIEVTDKSGKALYIEGEFVAGSPVTELDASGAKVPAADAEYELSDGTKFTVKGGMIDVITEPAAEQTPEAVATTKQEETKPADAPAAQFDAQAKFTELELSFNEIKTSIKELSDRLAQEKTFNEEKFAAIKVTDKVEKKEESVRVERKAPSLSALFAAMDKK